VNLLVDMRLGLCGLIICLGMGSCFKKDNPIVQLPPKTGSNIMQVQMGPKHDTTYYISLENATVVGKSLHNTWDIKFDATESGTHVLLNSGKSTRAFATTEKNITAITALPADIIWGYDAPTQSLDSTYIGDWHEANNASKNIVYIIRLADAQGNFTYKKLQFVSVNANKYVIRYCALESTTYNTLSIPKNEAYNYTFFSFANNGVVLPIEPPKTMWDMQVTRFSHVYYNLNPVVNYQVNGVLQNSFNTLTASDTLTEKDYNTFTEADANAMNFSAFPNAIGFTWKNFSVSQSDYVIYDKYVYAIRTQHNQLFKLHFTGYKMPNGESYAPKFEFERIQ
jgi:HmuY protein